LDVHYEVINAWCDVLNTTEKDMKDYDKTIRKYCFKTGFLVFFPICFSQHFYVICFDLQSGSFVLIGNNYVKNDSADRDLGITKALHSVFVDFLQSIEHRSYKKLRCAKLEVVKLDFKKRNDHANCRIIVMTAMDCYMGKVKKLKDMFLEGIPYTL
nr:hypothetical protein [Tanacetum cinerariifolium]